MSLTPETGGAAVKGTCVTGFRFLPERRHNLDTEPQTVISLFSSFSVANEPFPPLIRVLS
jgi:hypothetical protein